MAKQTSQAKLEILNGMQNLIPGVEDHEPVLSAQNRKERDETTRTLGKQVKRAEKGLRQVIGAEDARTQVNDMVDGLLKEKHLPPLSPTGSENKG